MRTRRGGEAPRIPELGGDRQCGEVIDPRKHRRRATRGRNGSRSKSGRRSCSTACSRTTAVDGTAVGTVRLVERGQRPGLRPEPCPMALRPRLLGRRETLAHDAGRIWRADAARAGDPRRCLPDAQQIARRLLLIRRDVNGGQRAGAMQDRQLGRNATIGLDPIPRTTRNQRGDDHVAGDPVLAQRR